MDESNPQPQVQPEHRPASQAAGAAGQQTQRPGKPWVVDVDVYLESDGADPKFRIESCLPKDKTDPNNVLLVFNNSCRPGFDINFNLYDQTGKGYRFPRQPNLADAVWSRRQSACPTQQADDEGILKPKNVQEPAGTTLVVFNDNPDETNGGPIGKFRYTLNVSTTGGPPYLALDPGGDDQDGSRTFVIR